MNWKVAEVDANSVELPAASVAVEGVAVTIVRSTSRRQQRWPFGCHGPVPRQ